MKSFKSEMITLFLSSDAANLQSLFIGVLDACHDIAPQAHV